MRITFKNEYDLGYVYAFLNTSVGLTLLQSNNYGAVIDHIEPEHLRNIPIPNAPIDIRKQIHELIVSSFDLRDQSNELIDNAQSLLYKELGLSKLSELKPKQYAENVGFRNFSIKVSRLNGRLDASYHVPEVEAIVDILYHNAAEVTTLGNKSISKDIVLPGRFKRIYVDKEHGVPFLGGKQLSKLDCTGVKYLSKKLMTAKFLYSSMISHNDIVMSARGTIGISQIVPLHWSGFLISDNIIKIIHANKENIGYVFCFLQTRIGRSIIKREISGSVVDVIEPKNLFNIPIPLLKKQSIQQRINDDVLQANELRYQAYIKEQEAIKKMEEIINTHI